MPPSFRKHPIGWGALITFLLVVIPQSTNAWWGLFVNQPLVPSIMRVVGPILAGIAWGEVLRWLSTGIGLGLVALIFAETRKVKATTQWNQLPVGVNSAAIAPVAPAPVVPAPASAPIEQQQHREFVALETKELTAFYKDMTSIQANKIVAPYISKWLTVSGRLREVLGSDTRAQVTFDDFSLDHGVYMYFKDQDAIDRLAMLRRGTPITVCGEITEVGSLSVTLHNCELMQVSQ